MLERWKNVRLFCTGKQYTSPFKPYVRTEQGIPTADGIPGRQSCWGTLAGRCEYLPRHHCSATAPALNGHQVCQPEKETKSIFSTVEICKDVASTYLRLKTSFSSAVCTNSVPRVWHLIFTLFSWFGMMQRTKLGFVFLKVVISLVSCSL